MACKALGPWISADLWPDPLGTSQAEGKPYTGLEDGNAPKHISLSGEHLTPFGELVWFLRCTTPVKRSRLLNPLTEPRPLHTVGAQSLAGAANLRSTLLLPRIAHSGGWLRRDLPRLDAVLDGDSACALHICRYRFKGVSPYPATGHA